MREEQEQVIPIIQDQAAEVAAEVPNIEAVTERVTQVMQATEASTQPSTNASEGMVRLKTYQVIAHKAGIDYKYWPVVAEFYKEIMFNGSRRRHPLDTVGSHKCISSKEWNRICGTTRDARVVQSILKRKVCNVIESYADGRGTDRAVYPKGYALKQEYMDCLLYTSPSPRDRTRSRMPSSA